MIDGERLALLEQLGFSVAGMRYHESWWNDTLQGFLHDCTDLVLKRVGRENVAAVFLCGSFAAMEGSVLLGKGRTLFLSDIDLVAVLKSLESLHEHYPRRSEIGSACESLLPDALFAGRIDIGMMLEEDLRRLPPRPGVYDMKVSGRMLYGDKAVLDSIPAYGASEIGGEEAVILVENRMVSLLPACLEAPVDDEPARFILLYRIARVYTDMLTSALCLSGSYAPGYAERFRIFLHTVESGGNNTLLQLLPPALMPRLRMWTNFKLSPSPDIPGLETEIGVHGTLVRAAARDLVDYWKKADAFAAGRRPVASEDTPTERLLDSRKRRSWSVDNARSWKAYLSGITPGRRIGVLLAMGKRLFSTTPLDVVREHGVRLLGSFVRDGMRSRVTAPRGGFPHRGGNWEEAARDIHSTWVELVFGCRELV
jgi:predicted nucleotidyltransferase